MYRLISLFDYTANWPYYFGQNGWDVIPVDIQNGHDILDFDSAGMCIDHFEYVNGILAAPPCTHFTYSGIRWWPEKDADGRTESHLEFVYQVLRMVDLFMPTDPDYFDETRDPFFWVIENPLGRLDDLIPSLGKPIKFDPCDYAGYLDISYRDHMELDRIRKKNGKGVTKKESEFVLQCNAYTKKTCLWGDFNRDIPKKRIEPVRCCKQGSPLQRLGGKSQATKNKRSATPLGFSKAFYEANKDYQPVADREEIREAAWQLELQL